MHEARHALASPLVGPEHPEYEYYGTWAYAAKSLPDRREVMIIRMVFNWRLVMTADPHGQWYEDVYCFHDPALVLAAFEAWDGETEPAGWAKHPPSGRRGPCPCDACDRYRALDAAEKR